MGVYTHMMSPDVAHFLVELHKEWHKEITLYSRFWNTEKKFHSDKFIVGLGLFMGFCESKKNDQYLQPYSLRIKPLFCTVPDMTAGGQTGTGTGGVAWPRLVPVPGCSTCLRCL